VARVDAFTWRCDLVTVGFKPFSTPDAAPAGAAQLQQFMAVLYVAQMGLTIKALEA
jgi:hypothetical protein